MLIKGSISVRREITPCARPYTHSGGCVYGSSACAQWETSRLLSRATIYTYIYTPLADVRERARQSTCHGTPASFKLIARGSLQWRSPPCNRWNRRFHHCALSSLYLYIIYHIYMSICAPRAEETVCVWCPSVGLSFLQPRARDFTYIDERKYLLFCCS